MPGTRVAARAHHLAVDEFAIVVVHDIQLIESAANDAAMHLPFCVCVRHQRLLSFACKYTTISGGQRA